MILNGKTAIEGVAAGAGLFCNGTGENSNSVECFDIIKEYFECSETTVISPRERRTS